MATLLPNGKQQFTDGNGAPLAGGSVAFYIPGTSSPKDTWIDADQVTLNSNPVVLDASGEAVIYGSGSYRQVVTDVDGNLIWDQLSADTAVGGIIFGGVSTGTANVQSISASSFTQQDGQQVTFFVGAGLTNTGALTISLSGGAPIAVLKDTPAGPTSMTGGEVAAGNAVTLIYSVSRGAFHLVQNDFTAASIPTQQSTKINFAFAVAVNTPGASQMTISIKALDGTDPSTLNPVYVPFRSATSSSGIPAQLAITAPLSLVVSSGSTLGTANGVIARLWVVLFNNAGTPQVGVVKPVSTTSKSVSSLRVSLASATAEGGGGGADSAQVIYASSLISGQPVAPIGYFEITQATAGTWATAPSLLQVYGEGVPLPGEIVQVARTETGAFTTGTTQIPFDNTTPQQTEGDQYMSQTITPTSGANVLRVTAQAALTSNASAATMMTLFQDNAANALTTTFFVPSGANAAVPLSLMLSQLALSTSATTFKIRGGAGAAGTTSFNGFNGGAEFNGTLNSYIQIEEIFG